MADRDGDGEFSFKDFCVAMKLVLMKKTGHAIPPTLPEELKEFYVPYQTEQQSRSRSIMDSVEADSRSPRRPRVSMHLPENTIIYAIADSYCFKGKYTLLQ